MATEIVVRGLRAGYGAVNVLQDVNLRVGEAETVALLGTNGNGKSTLMKSLMNIVKPSAGEIIARVDGVELNLRQMTTEQIVNSGIALVPEGRHLFPKLTVEENLLLGAYREIARPQIASNLEFVYEAFPLLLERRRQLAGSMSGGQQQMLAIARALMSGPQLLLLDEPSMGLAPIMVDRIFELIISARDSGVSILLVEQNARLALKVSSRAYVLESGKITLSGISSELLQDDRVRAAYLGEVIC